MFKKHYQILDEENTIFFIKRGKIYRNLDIKKQKTNFCYDNLTSFIIFGMKENVVVDKLYEVICKNILIKID